MSQSSTTDLLSQTWALRIDPPVAVTFYLQVPVAVIYNYYY